MRQLARAKRDAALKARCSFKMVISRLREHLARGQFNSGWMIAPSHLCCPSIFLRPPLSTPARDIIRFRSFELVLYTRDATLRLPHPLVSFFPQESARPRPRPRPLALAPLYDRLFYLSFFVSRFNDASTFPLLSNYFNGNCFSLVSIRVYNIRNFPIVVIEGDQAFSCIDARSILQSVINFMRLVINFWKIIWENISESTVFYILKKMFENYVQILYIYSLRNNCLRAKLYRTKLCQSKFPPSCAIYIILLRLKLI